MCIYIYIFNFPCALLILRWKDTYIFYTILALMKRFNKTRYRCNSDYKLLCNPARARR